MGRPLAACCLEHGQAATFHRELRLVPVSGMIGHSNRRAAHDIVGTSAHIDRILQRDVRIGVSGHGEDIHAFSRSGFARYSGNRMELVMPPKVKTSQIALTALFDILARTRSKLTPWQAARRSAWWGLFMSEPSRVRPATARRAAAPELPKVKLIRRQASGTL